MENIKSLSKQDNVQQGGIDLAKIILLNRGGCVHFVVYSHLLMKNMQLLMTSVDSLQQDTYRLLGYEKNVAKQIQAKQQFLQRRVCNM